MRNCTRSFRAGPGRQEIRQSERVPSRIAQSARWIVLFERRKGWADRSYRFDRVGSVDRNGSEFRRNGSRCYPSDRVPEAFPIELLVTGAWIAQLKPVAFGPSSARGAISGRDERAQPVAGIRPEYLRRRPFDHQPPILRQSPNFVGESVVSFDFCALATICASH
jgi:hypothetical protein